MFQFEVIFERKFSLRVKTEDIKFFGSQMLIKSQYLTDQFKDELTLEFENDFVPVQLSVPMLRNGEILKYYETPGIYLERSRAEIIEHKERLEEQQERERLDWRWMALDCSEETRARVKADTEKLKQEMMAKQKYKDGKWVDRYADERIRLMAINDTDIAKLVEWRTMPWINVMIRLRKMKRSDGVIKYPIKVLQILFQRE